MTAKFLKKIDDWLFKATSAVVIRWVKKKKHKQHKYDFAIMIKGWEAAWWLGVLIWQIFNFLVKRHVAAAIVSFVLMLVVAVLETFYFWIMKQAKHDYDIRFANRKNPIIYQIEKEVMQAVREATLEHRLMGIVVMFTLSVLVLFINPLLLPIYLAGLLQMYISLVFDFDDPDKKEKEKKESLTEVALKAWRNLTGALNPKGI